MSNANIRDFVTLENGEPAEIVINAPASAITIEGTRLQNKETKPAQAITVNDYSGQTYKEYRPELATAAQAGPAPAGSIARLEIRERRTIHERWTNWTGPTSDLCWVLTLDIVTPAGVVHSSDPVLTPTGRKHKSFKSLDAAEKYAKRYAKKANA